MAMSKETTVEALLITHACQNPAWCGDENGFILTERCIPGSEVRAVRSRGLQKIYNSINSGAGWLHDPIIVEAVKMKHNGERSKKVWYRVIDGMHRVTVAAQLAARGNMQRTKVITCLWRIRHRALCPLCPVTW